MCVSARFYWLMAASPPARLPAAAAVLPPTSPGGSGARASISTVDTRGGRGAQKNSMPQLAAAPAELGYENPEAKLRYQVYRCEYLRYEAYRWAEPLMGFWSVIQLLLKGLTARLAAFMLHVAENRACAAALNACPAHALALNFGLMKMQPPPVNICRHRGKLPNSRDRGHWRTI